MFIHTYNNILLQALYIGILNRRILYTAIKKIYLLPNSPILDWLSNWIRIIAGKGFKEELYWKRVWVELLLIVVRFVIHSFQSTPLSIIYISIIYIYRNVYSSRWLIGFLFLFSSLCYISISPRSSGTIKPSGRIKSCRYVVAWMYSIFCSIRSSSFLFQQRRRRRERRRNLRGSPGRNCPVSTWTIY